MRPKATHGIILNNNATNWPENRSKASPAASFLRFPWLYIRLWRRFYTHTHIPHELLYLFIHTTTAQIHQIRNPAKSFKIRQVQSRTRRTFKHKNQTPFSICYGSQKSTYNIPKRREKHALHHRIIKTIKQTRLQKFTI